MFTVIPVIDLLDGQVVHAQRGDRANYQPIHSPLCADASPQNVVAGLLSVYRFPVFYIADLGAITSGSNHRSQVQALIEKYRHITWWVDAGFSDLASLQDWRHRAIQPVVGTESINDINVLNAGNGAVVLSLDRKHDDVYDTLDIHGQADRWPEQVIVMTLDKVGSASGPDFKQLANTQMLKPTASLYAAGGVRHGEDLAQLKANGVAGALIATALHNGSITSDDLSQLEDNGRG